jgi:LysR family nitrogen assimilation transcriptional regulator
MDIKQIKYFLAVAEAGGFSKAAQQIHVAQPALSAHVARLEESLGVQLFVRSAKGIELTHAGDMLVDHAHDILRRLKHAHWPHIRLRLVEGRSGWLQEWLLAGRIDAAVLFGSAAHKGLRMSPIK